MHKALIFLILTMALASPPINSEQFGSQTSSGNLLEFKDWKGYWSINPSRGLEIYLLRYRNKMVLRDAFLSFIVVEYSGATIKGSLTEHLEERYLQGEPTVSSPTDGLELSATFCIATCSFDKYVETWVFSATTGHFEARLTVLGPGIREQHQYVVFWFFDFDVMESYYDSFAVVRGSSVQVETKENVFQASRDQPAQWKVYERIWFQEYYVMIWPDLPLGTHSAYVLVYRDSEAVRAQSGGEPVVHLVDGESITRVDLVIWVETSFLYLRRCESGLCSIGYSFDIGGY